MKRESIYLKRQLSTLPCFDEFRKSMDLDANDFSQESRNMLDEFFQRIHMCEKEWNKKKTEILRTLRVLKPSELNDKVKNDYRNIPSNIRKSIQTSCQKLEEVCIHFHNRSYYFHICGPLSMKNAHIESIIHHTFLWLSFVNEYVDPKCAQNVNIFLFLVSNLKCIPHIHNQVINTDHINTAFTYSCLPKTDIYIFREEEWYRALIHETFHTLGLDFIRMGTTTIHSYEAEIKKMWPVPIPDLRIYETYCEMWAEVLNAMFYVYNENQIGFSSKGRLPLREWKRQWAECMFYERAFSVWQCTKLLAHYNIEYEHLSKRAALYKENTQGFSYYVLKCILSVHLRHFLHFCATQWKDRFSVQFHLTGSFLRRYCMLFIKYAHSAPMIYGTRYMHNHLKSKKHTPFYKTMRMSMIQFTL